MGNFFYPQLTSGSLAQYPLCKTRIARTIKNVMPDGNLILLPDFGAARMMWQLEYAHLPFADVQSLQSHFQTCKGPLSAFTFIDPTGNMLRSSADLTALAWQKSSLLHIQGWTPDPFGGMTAQTVINYGQNVQELTQNMRVPANYQYCFSFYAMAVEQATLTVFRRGLNSQQSNELSVHPGWTRLISRGRLNDSGSILTVGIGLAAGQSVEIFGMQLEAQISPSRYQPTTQTGGVYTNAYWAMEQLEIIAEGVDSYATTVNIETTA